MRRFDIPPIDAPAARAAAERQRILTKPPGSLGRLEDVACRLAGIQGTALPTVRNRWIVVAAADHGVTGDSVSAYPQEVTAQMVLNFLSGGAAINVLARHCGARLMVVDAGIRGPELTEVGSRFHGNDGGEDGKDEGTDSNGEGTDSNDEGTDSNGEGTDSNGEGADGNDGGADGSDEGTDGNDKGADGNDVDTGGNDGGTGGNDEGTGLRTMRAGSGTANFAREPAMSLEQAKLSISNGAEVADDLARSGRTFGRRWRYGHRQHELRGSNLRRHDRDRPCAGSRGEGPGLTTPDWCERSPSFAAASICTSPTRQTR